MITGFNPEVFITGSAKVQRVIAPRRPTDIITTSSWRTGQQTVKRILGPAKKKKTSPEVSRPQSRSSQDTDISAPRSLNFHWKGEVKNKKSDVPGDTNVSGNGKDSSVKGALSRESSPVHEEHVNGLVRKGSGWLVDHIFQVIVLSGLLNDTVVWDPKDGAY